MEEENIEDYLLKNIIIDCEADCWEWQKSCDSHGYGVSKRTEYIKTRKAHRLSYLVFKGGVIDNLCVCHKCDNPKCINPEHLFLGTHQDNMSDMAKKGRNKNNTVPQYGNNYSGIKVMANYKIYSSYCEAARDVGISDNGIRKRIKSGRPGYEDLGKEYLLK